MLNNLPVSGGTGKQAHLALRGRGEYRERLLSLLGGEYEVKDEKFSWRIYRLDRPVGGVDLARLDEHIAAKNAIHDPAYEMLLKLVTIIKNSEKQVR